MSKNKIKWTDKIQAIAAIIAILGGLAGFYKLFSTDKEVQEQIDNLAIIAKEFSEQTIIMREELENSRMRNNLLIEQLSVDKDKWNKQNQPDFTLDLHERDSWIGSEEGIVTIEGFSIVNKGGAAHLINVTNNDKNNCEILMPKTYVPNQGKVKFSLSYSENKDLYLDINLIYRAFDGEYYSQRFKSDIIKKEKLSDLTNFEFLNITNYNPIKTHR